MKFMANLWGDESGSVVSAELVAVGAVAVAGASIGLSKMTSSLNKELTAAAASMRSFDQSIKVRGRFGRHAWSGATSHIQPLNEEGQPESSVPAKVRSLRGAQPEASTIEVEVPEFAEDDLSPLSPLEETPDADEVQTIVVPASDKL